MSLQTAFEKSEAALAFAKRLDQAAQIFNRAGFATDVTLQQAVPVFLEQNHFEPLPMPRGVFHEVCHIIGGRLDASSASEQIAVINAKVFMFTQGKVMDPNFREDTDYYDIRHPENRSDDEIYDIAQDVYHRTCNGRSLSDPEIFSAITQARQQRALFTSVTGGRQLFQFSTRSLDIPAAFFGVHAVIENEKLHVTPFTEQERQNLIQRLKPDEVSVEIQSEDFTP